MNAELRELLRKAFVAGMIYSSPSQSVMEEQLSFDEWFEKNKELVSKIF